MKRLCCSGSTILTTKHFAAYGCFSAGSQCYQPEELALMRWIDELHLNHPFAGARMLSKMFKREGNPVGSPPIYADRVNGNPCAYRKPNTSKHHQAHPVPYLLRNLPITRSNHAWAADITYIPMKCVGFHLSVR